MAKQQKRSNGHGEIRGHFLFPGRIKIIGCLVQGTQAVYALPGKTKSPKPDKPEPKSGSCLPAIIKRGFIVSGLRTHQVGRIIFFVFIFFNMAEARDLSILQSAVAYAREDMEKAQKDAILSEKQYLEAQKKYQKAQSTLDQAWNKK